MRVLLLGLLILLFPPDAGVWVWAHGADYSIGSGGVVINAEYDDGTPMSYAETEVMPPDSDLPFASGWTDRNGRFCFLPDMKGPYRITIKDGKGHMIAFTLPVSGTIAPDTHQKEERPVDRVLLRYQKIFSGLALIVFVSGIVFWLKGRQLKKVDKTVVS